MNHPDKLLPDIQSVLKIKQKFQLINPGSKIKLINPNLKIKLSNPGSKRSSLSVYCWVKA